jgi:protein SCO1
MVCLELKTVSMSRIACWLISIFFIACSTENKQPSLPYYNKADFTPMFLSKEEAKIQVTHTIGDFSMTDQQNKTITDKDINGKIHVANFFFSRCGTICPKMTNNLLLLQDAIAQNDDVVIISYSVTPWQDSAQALKAFADRYQITSPNWHLLTGSTKEIYDLARKSYFAEQDLGLTKDSTEFLHTEHILLVDGDKKLRGIYNGTLQLEIQQLIKDIKKLQLE